MTDAASLTQRLNDIIQVINEANASMDNGALPALSTLDQQVAQICLDIEQSEAAVARQTQPLMAQMITNLDELALKLQKFQAQIQAEEKDI